MNVVESMRIALRSLSANKMRSGLTMLGIIIGVMAVVAMLSIGQGAQAAITNQIDSIGTNLLFIRPGATQQGGVRSAEGSAATLTVEDAQALVGVSNVVAVAPEVDSFGQVAYLGNNANARVIGVTPDYQNALNRERGLTIVLVTHDSNVAAQAQRIIPMRDGQVVEQGETYGSPDLRLRLPQMQTGALAS